MAGKAVEAEIMIRKLKFRNGGGATGRSNTHDRFFMLALTCH